MRANSSAIVWGKCSRLRISACGSVSPAVSEFAAMSSASGSSLRTFMARRALMRLAMNSGIDDSPARAALAMM